jgi:hypothetical protein
MTRAKIYVFTIAILIASVPWFFFEARHDHILGLPVWALYSLVMTVVYAVAVAIVLQKYWPLLSGAEGDTEDA